MAEAEYLQQVITGHVKFQIPEYQRNYSWEKEQFEDLWRDLNNVKDEDSKNHFYGMFLFERKNNLNKIIDGQQRITTVIILLNEIRQRFEELGEENKAESIKRGYIENVNGYKLKLGTEKDNLLLQDTILDRRKIEKDVEEIADSPSQRKLLQAKKFFNNKLENKEEEFLKDLKDEIINLEVLTYEVESITRAVKIFETANDRGRDLTDLDKTKSFLMLQIYLNKKDKEEEAVQDNIELLQARFGKMYEHVEEINQENHWGDFSEDNIQRSHYILWDEEWSHSREERYFQNLLEHLKSKIRASKTPLEDITDYSKKLKEAFGAQESLSRKGAHKEERRIIRRMELVGSMGNIRPLLMALRVEKDTLGKEEYLEILELVETLVIRMYAIIQRPAYTARYPLYYLAREVYNQELNSEEIKQELREIIEDKASDKRVRRELTEEYDDFFSEFGKQEIRFLLYFFEASKQRDTDRQRMPFNLEEWVNGKLVGTDEEVKIEVDHIHPQSPQKDIEVKDEVKNCIGNLSILPEGENKSLQNAVQADKEDAYKHVNLDMNKDIVPLLETWDGEKIKNREKEIVEHVLDRWSY